MGGAAEWERLFSTGEARLDGRLDDGLDYIYALEFVTTMLHIHLDFIHSAVCQVAPISAMASFGPAGGVSVFELCIYLPAVLVALFVCSRHGFSRSSGWVFTLILCLARIVGACCQLATYQSETSGLLEAVVILDSVGVSPDRKSVV